MNDLQIIELLKRTGHLEFPFGRGRHDVPDDLSSLPLSNPGIERAIASYQDFNVICLEPLCTRHHGRTARCDGEIGPATRELFEIARCGCPDYGELVLPATGNGSWKNCHKIGDFHAATVYVHEDQMPSFLKPYFGEIWDLTVAAYEEIGLRFIRTDDKAAANIDFSWETKRTGWIGLAIVGRGETCGSHIWCKYSVRYQPADIVREITTLTEHELGHNCGLEHTRSGKMSPYIVNGLKPTWKGDASESILKRYFGGEPIDPTPPPKPGKRYAIVQHYHVNEEGVTVTGEQWEMKPRPEVPA